MIFMMQEEKKPKEILFFSFHCLSQVRVMMMSKNTQQEKTAERKVSATI
jgi:hypothetical protein